MWAKENVDSRNSYSLESYLRKGLFYDRNNALKPHQLTDDNSFVYYDPMDAYDKVIELSKIGKEAGVLVANRNLGIQPYLGGEFVREIKDFYDTDAYFVFFKTDDVDNYDRNKPRPFDKYNWSGPKSQIVGNNRESEFRERRAYNNADKDTRRRMDNYTKNNNYAGWDSVKDQINSLYPKEGRSL